MRPGHVPTLVCDPRVGSSSVSDDLVTLTDVTATILQLAGEEVPAYADARPLPGLELAGEARRDHVFGVLKNGWMLFNATWKLCKYPRGDHLFNLAEDPTEQHNRIGDPSCSAIYDRLDALLTSEIMRFVAESAFSGRHETNSSSADFGRVGWERKYPMPWGGLSN
ncbi:MAG: hypothetical protein CME26_10500 [Gemmatimonadetes bacterium]|nr:hypothetical protein [Gemmatimonadota bacterium]